MLRSLPSLLLLFALAPRIAEAQASPPEFIVHTADGILSPAPLVKLTEGWKLRLGGQTPRVVDGADFVALRRDGIVPPPFPTKNVVVLSNGDRLPFAPLVGLRPLHDEMLHLPSSDGLLSGVKDVVTLSPAYASMIWFTAPAGDDDAAVALLRMRQARRPRDLVVFRNGDRLEGTIKTLDAARGCRLDADGNDAAAPLSRLAVVAFSTELQARPRTKLPFGVATLTGGARLTFASLSLNEDRTRLSGRMLAGPEVSFPLDRLIALEIYQGRAVYLSDLNVKSYEATPFLSQTWPLGKDQSTGGSPLRVGTGWFDKGLGMRGQCRVTYRLDGAFQRFEAWAGLDAASGPRSRLRFAVLLDGREQDLKASAERTLKDPPLDIQVDVTGAKELTLCTEFGSFGDVEALATWANARLIKK